MWNCSEERSSDERHRSSRSRHDDTATTDTQVSCFNVSFLNVVLLYPCVFFYMGMLVSTTCFTSCLPFGSIHRHSVQAANIFLAPVHQTEGLLETVDSKKTEFVRWWKNCTMQSYLACSVIIIIIIIIIMIMMIIIVVAGVCFELFLCLFLFTFVTVASCLVSAVNSKLFSII